MEAIWMLVGLAVGGVVGAWVMLGLERSRRAGAENTEVVRLQAQLEAAESTAQTLASAREELLALIKQGAGEEVSQRGSEVVELMKAHLETALTQAGADDETRKQAVAGLVDPMNTTLKQL